METIKLMFQIPAAALGCVAMLTSILLFMQLRWSAPVLFGVKLFASALSPVFVITGVLCAAIGCITGSALISLIGIYNVFVFCYHIFKVTRQPINYGSFQHAFGVNWETCIHPEQKMYFLKKKISFKLPVVPEPRIKENVAFYTIPGTDRQLLCDLWEPHQNIKHSGLAFIYLHGSAWYLLDKDCGTRTFFKHLAAQGHVIMDVAYRLAPETGMMGMVHDVKHAIAWMKENGAAYGVKPDRITVGGGSAGGHLALLAAYTASNIQFTPKDLEGSNLKVCAVISLYGPSDLKACYYHTNQHLTTRTVPGKPKKAVPTTLPMWVIKAMGKEYYRLGMNKGFDNAGAMAPLLGGHPDECPQLYALYSPVSHVHPDCPPTLLLQGEHDLMTPVRNTRSLRVHLQEKRVRTVMHIIPQTDHAFDLILPKISQSAHTAFYDVERFLGIMAGL